jgi:hypothetical protein
MAMLYKFLEPGIYAYVNHNMTEAVELGATAIIKVDGPWDNDLMTQVKPPGAIEEPAIAQGSSKQPSAPKAVADAGKTPIQPAKTTPPAATPEFFHVFQ